MVSYIFRFALIVVFAAPLYMVLRSPWRQSGRREIYLGLFALFMIGLMVLVLRGKYTDPYHMIVRAAERIRTGERINIVPFRTIRSFYGRAGGTDNLMVNIVGNIVMFVPWGLGVVMLWKKNQTVWRAALLSAGLPVLIEASQLFIERAVDVDDFILNFTGGCMGALLYAGIRKCFPRIEMLAV